MDLHRDGLLRYRFATKPWPPQRSVANHGAFLDFQCRDNCADKGLRLLGRELWLSSRAQIVEHERGCVARSDSCRRMEPEAAGIRYPGHSLRQIYPYVGQR